MDENKITDQDSIKEGDYVIENIPIHTMAKDIQTIENPSIKKTLYPEKDDQAKLTPELNNKQKSSPFLNPSEKVIFSDETRPKSNPDYSQINKVIQPKINSISETNSSSASRSLFVVIILLIIIFIGAGTYYFITTQDTALVNPNLEEDLAKPNAVVESATPASSISSEKPNYLVIDVATANPTAIKKALEKNAQAVLASGLQVPIEFIVVDAQNSPISFSDFAAMSNLAFAEKIMAQLEKNFSLFFFNDRGNIGLGLNLKTLDPLLLKNQLSQEEPLLHSQLPPLFLYPQFTPPTTPFQNHTYKNHTIRYQNLISAQKLSIDYAFQEKSLIIATTQLTMEALLDRLSPR